MEGIEIIKNENNPEPTELIAESIIKISEAFERIENSGLTRRALVLLLHDSSGVGKRDINFVLDHLSIIRKYVNSEE